MERNNLTVSKMQMLDIMDGHRVTVELATGGKITVIPSRQDYRYAEVVFSSAKNINVGSEVFVTLPLI